jgi:peptidyl-prolyl cis-trans isomerase-like protein 2
MLARAGKYDNCLFHRLVPGFMVSLTPAFVRSRHVESFRFLLHPQIQSGDPTGTGAGGESYWGTPFRDEHDMKGAARHNSRGVLAMANKGPGTNGQVSSNPMFNFISDF